MIVLFCLKSISLVLFCRSIGQKVKVRVKYDFKRPIPCVCVCDFDRII